MWVTVGAAPFALHEPAVVSRRSCPSQLAGRWIRRPPLAPSLLTYVPIGLRQRVASMRPLLLDGPAPAAPGGSCWRRSSRASCFRGGCSGSRHGRRHPGPGLLAAAAPRRRQLHAAARHHTSRQQRPPTPPSPPQTPPAPPAQRWRRRRRRAAPAAPRTRALAPTRRRRPSRWSCSRSRCWSDPWSSWPRWRPCPSRAGTRSATTCRASGWATTARTRPGKVRRQALERRAAGAARHSQPAQQQQQRLATSALGAACACGRPPPPRRACRI
jgi:hypothetical protein